MKDEEQKSVQLVNILPSLLVIVFVATPTLVYSAGTIFAPTFKSTTKLTSNINPSTYGQSITITATVTGGALNGEVVTFYNGSTVVGTAKISSGAALLKISSLAGGTHYLTANYPGDASISPSTSNVYIQTVQPFSTTTSLTASSAQLNYGQTDTFTAKVSGSANNDIVTFYDNYTIVGTAPTSSNTAILKLATLSGGTHSITARFNGETNYTASTSTPIIVTIKPISTSISLTSSTSGQITTIMATVSTSTGSIPNGELVTFYDGSTKLGTSPLTSGSASFVTSSLPQGSDQISATYPGDADYLQSSSTPITVVSSSQSSNTIGIQPTCLLRLNISSGATNYIAPQKITIYYTVSKLGLCSVPNAVGSLTLSDAATGIVYSSTPINVSNIVSTPVTRVAYLNSSILPTGSNLAALVLTAGSLSNISTTSFYMIQPANITVKSFYVYPNKTVTGSPFWVVTKIINNQFFPAYNASLNLRVVAPNFSTYDISQPIGKVSAFQNFTLETDPGLAGVPTLPGKYFVISNVSFNSNYSSSGFSYATNTIFSNTSVTSYTVLPNPGNIIATGFEFPPTSIGSVLITSFPFYTDVPSGNDIITNLDNVQFYNPGNTTVALNMTIPRFSYGKLSSSTSSVILPPKQSGFAGLQFLSHNAVSGAYTLPLNISLSSPNGTSTTTLYTMLDLYNETGTPEILRSASITNGNNATVRLDLENPTNNTLYKILVTTKLNSSITNSANNIVVSGDGANTILMNGSYVISWQIDELTQHNNIALTYSVSNISEMEPLLLPPTSMLYTKQYNLTTFNIIRISKPQTVYTNTTVNITISSIYSGANESTISITLKPTQGGAIVANSTETFKVIPDSPVDAKFTISTGPYPGNDTFELITPGPFAPQTQYIMLNVQPKPAAVYTIAEYLEDPRTIFGILTLAIYITSTLYGRVSRMYKERKLRKQSTVKDIDELRQMKNKINVAILSSGTATRTFRRHPNKDGTLGGFVEDGAIVGKDAIVASTALVEGDAVISGNAKILSNATVSDHAVVRGKAIISDKAKVGDDSEIYGNAQLSGNAKVFGDCEVFDNAKVYGEAEVFGNAHVFGEAEAFGSAKIYGNAEISGDAKVKSRNISKGNIVSGTL